MFGNKPDPQAGDIVRFHGLDFPPFEKNFALCRRQQAHDGSESRALAGPVATYQDGHGICLGLKRDTLENMVLTNE
jgi:hypothetical protein